MIDKKRVERLKKYVEEVLDGVRSKELYLSYQEDIDSITPDECFEIFTSKIDKGHEPREILKVLDRIINVFHESLSEYKWERPKENSFLDIMIRENREMEKKLEDIKSIIKKKDSDKYKEILLVKVIELEEFDSHYLKKENILFPYMEKKMKRYEGLTIMWSLHDQAREDIKETAKILREETINLGDFNRQIGQLFFSLMGLAHKEDYILYPVASELFNEEELEDMNSQSLDYDFPFIDKPKIKRIEKETLKEFSGMKFKTETGELDFEQILLIFNNLPVDFSFVDENDRVRYFSSPKDRIFPRSPAVIGREVKFCHPSESLHVVEEIVEKFKSGQEETASFWLDLRGRKILIQYFALRNDRGDYKGVLEVSQDISQIQKLEGERRLLSWGL